MAGLQLDQVPLEARGGQLAVPVEIGEQQPDLGQLMSAPRSMPMSRASRT